MTTYLSHSPGRFFYVLFYFCLFTLIWTEPTPDRYGNYRCGFQNADYQEVAL